MQVQHLRKRYASEKSRADRLDVALEDERSRREEVQRALNNLEELHSTLKEKNTELASLLQEFQERTVSFSLLRFMVQLLTFVSRGSWKKRGTVCGATSVIWRREWQR